MNKNIKRIIALTLTLSAFSAISAITPGMALDITTKPVYAASYSPDDGELKSLKIKSIDGDSLSLRNGYNGSTVKLNDDKEYFTKLTDKSEGIKIDATVEGKNYVAKIFTSDKADATAYEAGGEILLGKGDTTLYVRTYKSESAFRSAKNSKHDVSICEEEYEINVRKTTESSYEDTNQDPIYLYNIEPSRGDITFLKQKTNYDLKVDSSIDNIKITATPEDEKDRVRIDGTLVSSEDKYKKAVSLDEGKNEIKIKVTDSKDNQRTYTINVTRGNASDTQDNIYLDKLTLSEGEIDFSEDETSYDVNLDETVSKITIGAEPEDEDYSVTIDGDEVNSDDDYEKKISLDKGENVIEVRVQDEVNDKKRTYKLTINRGDVKDGENTETGTDTNTNTDTSDKNSGWVKTTDGWKYYDEKGKSVENSWLQDKEKWYLFNQQGVMLTGWQEKDSKWYLLDKDGEMRTGWYKEETTSQDKANTSSDTETDRDKTTTNTTKTETWYYFNTDGSMKTGWLLNDGKWYFFNLDGKMQKGWLIYSNSKYYLNEDGTLVTGTKTIDGKEYKFTSNGVLIL